MRLLQVLGEASEFSRYLYSLVEALSEGKREASAPIMLILAHNLNRLLEPILRAGLPTTKAYLMRLDPERVDEVNERIMECIRLHLEFTGDGAAELAEEALRVWQRK